MQTVFQLPDAPAEPKPAKKAAVATEEKPEKKAEPKAKPAAKKPAAKKED
jgi:hypothetical protein